MICNQGYTRQVLQELAKSCGRTRKAFLCREVAINDGTGAGQTNTRVNRVRRPYTAIHWLGHGPRRKYTSKRIVLPSLSGSRPGRTSVRARVRRSRSSVRAWQLARDSASSPMTLSACLAREPSCRISPAVERTATACRASPARVASSVSRGSAQTLLGSTYRVAMGIFV